MQLEEPLCEACEQEGFGCTVTGVPGVLAAMDEHGNVAIGAKIERCDMCCRFHTDEAAEQAMVAAGKVYYGPDRPHPKCSHCGSEEFQVVEDLPIMYRYHTWEHGVLKFEPECQEKAWDGSGCTYRYLECRSCTTPLDVPFSFDDGQDDKPRKSRGNPHKVAIVTRGGLVQDVFATDQLDVEILDCDDSELPEDDEEQAEIAKVQARADALVKMIADGHPEWRVVH